MRQDTGSRVSVCLLAFNHVDTIESTVRSVLSQAATGFEFIVSDDCSTDGTWERIAAMAAADSRIDAIRTPQNIGMAANANFAASKATREYIALLHHDDVYRTDLIAKWAGVLERHHDVAFVFNPYADHGGDFLHQVHIPAESLAGDWFLKRHLFARWGCCVRGTAMVRRDCWMEVGGMRESFGLLADIDLWMRLAMRWKVGYVNEPVITVRHERPEYYPAIYTGKTWSWTRQRLLYEIHAANRLDYFGVSTVKGAIRWLAFKIKLNAETMKWLLYAVVRRKRSMIESSVESATPYDMWPLRVLRRVLLRVAFVAGAKRAK